MRRRLILGVAVVGIALVAAVSLAITYTRHVQSANTNAPPGLLSPTQALASMSAANALVATGRAKTPTTAGEVATLTAVAQPIPTCVSTPAVTATPLPTADASDPLGGYFATQRVLNAPFYHEPGKVTDLAPQVPREQKGSLLIRHANCTYEDFLVTGDQSDAFLRNLPPGDILYSAGPPPAGIGQHPGYRGPPVTPAPAEATKLATTPGSGNVTATPSR